MNQEDGQILVKFAKETILAHFSEKQPDISIIQGKFDYKRGVFVTLTKDGQLRGCIGYPLPIYPLWQAVGKAANAAAFTDPRFSPLKEDEKIEVEVSVLTVPKQIGGAHDNYPDAIEIGKHGLIVESGWSSGLLLPQVATENNWDATVFLEQTCVKAGLPSEEWRQQKAKVYFFEAEIFNDK